MDRVVGVVVSLMVFIARCARYIPGVRFSRWQPGQKLKILLVGYNGARNTGADVRVAEIVKQIKAILGEETVAISVMTLNAQSVRSYFDADVELVEFSAIFCFDAFKLCSAHHMALLCEGSTLKSKFANALTLFYCEVAGIMKAQKKLCIAYGSEAGEMDLFIKRMAKRMFAETHFIARTQNSLEVVEALGVKAQLGTDTAWSFDASRAHVEARQILLDSGWDGKKPLLGIAVINPFWWPVKPSIFKTLACVITGNRSLHFQKWYHFSWSEERKLHFQTYVHALAHAANTMAATHGFQPVIIGMEKLDEEACFKLRDLLDGSVPLVLSKHFDGFVITEVLRNLSLLITSRYHAQVLSMERAVPTVAVSMDERLTNLAQDMGFENDLLCFANAQTLIDDLPRALDYALENRECIQRRIAERFVQYQSLMDTMGDSLLHMIQEAFPELVTHKTNPVALCAKSAAHNNETASYA